MASGCCYWLQYGIWLMRRCVEPNGTRVTGTASLHMRCVVHVGLLGGAAAAFSFCTTPANPITHITGTPPKIKTTAAACDMNQTTIFSKEKKRPAAASTQATADEHRKATSMWR